MNASRNPKKILLSYFLPIPLKIEWGKRVTSAALDSEKVAEKRKGKTGHRTGLPCGKGGGEQNISPLRPRHIPPPLLFLIPNSAMWWRVSLWHAKKEKKISSLFFGRGVGEGSRRRGIEGGGEIGEKSRPPPPPPISPSPPPPSHKFPK